MPTRVGDTRDLGLVPASGRPPGGGHGSPLQYSCLENPTDRGAWRATVHGVAKNRTQVSKFSHSVVPDSATPWTSARQAPLSMRFCRQGYWSGLPFPSPWDPPNPGIKPRSPALHADSFLTELPGKPSFEYKLPKDRDFVLIHHFILGIWNRL